MSVVKERLERLYDERTRAEQNIEEVRAAAEAEDGRDLTESESEIVAKWRTRLGELDGEIDILAEDMERTANARDVSKLLRDQPDDRPNPAPVDPKNPASPVVYRTFAQFARDQIIVRQPTIASKVRGPEHEDEVRKEAVERLERAVQHTLSSDVPGLLPPQHMAQIMDIINGSRPVVASARQVNLNSGKLTYPKIAQRPEVLKQGTEKTEAGTKNMQVTLEDMTADTYLGAGNLSWQTINWSTPDALQLWFDLAAEAYARATENAACDVLEAAAFGTASGPLGTAGTESLAQWRAAVINGISSIYTTTGGRARTAALYLAADRFFQLAKLGDANVTNLTAIGNLSMDTMTGTFNGLRVVGSYGFTPGIAIIGDPSAFLVGETAGAPVELRAVEPSIGGMEVGVIGAFAAQVYDDARFLNVSVV